MTLEFGITFDDIPFILDEAQSVGMAYESAAPVFVPESKQPAKQYQTLVDLIDEIERMMPTKYVNDVYQSRSVEGANLANAAQLERVGSPVDADVCLYDYVYPPSARRFSIFRGLMTSECVKSLVQSTDGGHIAKTFRMRMRPHSPKGIRNRLSTYTIETEMSMLPPRCIGENAGPLDGLYLVTLVDERYYWQDSSITLHANQFTTWDDLIELLARKLNVTIATSTIESVYGQPELDSQLWTNEESAPILLDAVAYNVGRVVVREYDGTYSLLTPNECNARVTTNRGLQRNVERVAGGDIYQSGGNLPVGRLASTRNSVLPASVNVVFPKYVEGDDPVPHYLNPRYAPQRPTAWVEDSYGDVHVKNVSAGQVSGVTGVTGFSGSATLTVTAKALYDTESAARSGGTPTNVSGLDAIATKFVSDYYHLRAFKALDETYPGIIAWQPDGIHDVIFTYSARRRGAFTRITKTEWNQIVSNFQTATPPSDPTRTSVVRGVGGHSVALTVRDDVASGLGASLTLATSLASGVVGSLSFNSGMTSGLPSSGNFRGRIDDEILYMRKTGDSTVDVVYRAIDGTKQAEHASGAALRQITPNTQYGTNLITAGGALGAVPRIWTSGGISEALLDVKPGGITNIYIGSGAITSGMITSGALHSGIMPPPWPPEPPVDYPPYYFSGTLTSGLLSGGSNIPKIVIVMDTDVYIRGITQGREGRLLYLLNIGTGKVTLGDQQGPVVNGIPTSILLPVPNVGAGASGYASGYTIWPRNGVILEFVSGLWRFDHPTFAGGDHGSTGFNTLGPPVTYALQHLRAGSGLGYRDNNDGSANIYVLSGAGGGGGTFQGYGARIFKTTDQSISNNTVTRVEFDDEFYNSTGYWSPSSGSLLVAGRGGYHVLGAHVEWDSALSAATLLSLRLVVDGVEAARQDSERGVAGGGGQYDALSQSITTGYLLSSGVICSVEVYHNTGASRNITRNDDFSIQFWINFIGSA